MRVEKEKYILRTWRMDDRASLAIQANNIHIWNNVRDMFPYPYTEKNAEEFITMVAGKSCLQDFAIEIDGRAVGGVGFIPGSDVERLNAEIGYWLGEPYWGHGIMSDAVKTLSGYVFDNTEIIRLFAGVYEYNHVSMKVLEKTGFTKVGVLHKAAVKNGNVIDVHYYELVK